MRNDTLVHYGILGQKWGVRRFQNSDGSLTSAGKKRYSDDGSEQESSSSSSSSSSGKIDKKMAAKIAVGVLATASVAAVTAYAVKNPEKVSSLINKVKDVNVKELSSSLISKGKDCVKSVASETASGVKDGAKSSVSSVGSKIPGVKSVTNAVKGSVGTGVKEAISGIKEGAKEGVHGAAKKTTQALITGATLNAAKKILDNVVGTEESAKIFQANDKEKIGKFWKVQPEDKEKESG